MDALAATRNYLTFVGIDVGHHESKYMLCWKYYIRSASVLVNLGLIGFQVYNIIFLDTLYLMAYAQIVIYSLQLVTYTRVLSRAKNVFKLMDQAFKLLNKEEITTIKRYDKRHFLFKVLLGVAILVMGSAYFVANGVGPETTAMAVALRKGNDVSPVVILLLMMAFTMSSIAFALIIQCYVSLLNVMQMIANHIQARIHRSRDRSPPDYELIVRSLEWYNDLMQAINEDLGIMPFAIFGMKFIVFSGGITFLITNGDEIHITPAFALLSIGSSNLLYLVFAYQIIQKSSNAWNVMSRCWKMAGDCITEQVIGSGTRESKKMKKALKFFLTTEQVIEAKACDTIVIDRSLVLSFVSQLIPFTVMMFTTVKEFDRKN